MFYAYYSNHISTAGASQKSFVGYFDDETLNLKYFRHSVSNITPKQASLKVLSSAWNNHKKVYHFLK